MTTTTTSSSHKKAQRWFEKRLYEEKELEGMSDEEMVSHVVAQTEMLIAPINEAFRKGEISSSEASRRILHLFIKAKQEDIKENEEDIEHILAFGRADTKNPKLLEKQRVVMEKRRREDPTIQMLQAQIEEWKKEIAKAEQKIQETYSLEEGK
jgi:hypothetical protein